MPPKSKFRSAQEKEATLALRSAFNAGRIGPNLEALLDEHVGEGWKKTREYRQLPFEEVLRLLRVYAEDFGHTAVPVSYRTADGYRLGSWVLNVRTGRNRTGFRRLSDEHVAALEALPGWAWDARVPAPEPTAI